MACKDTIRVRRDDGREEEVPIEDFFEPFLPEEPEFDPFETPGGDPANIDRITGGSFDFSAAADGEDSVRITLQVVDTQGRGVGGQTVTVTDKDGTTVADDGETDELGNVEFNPTSTVVGIFNLAFNHPDTDVHTVEIEFEDPDTFEGGNEDPPGEETGLAAFLAEANVILDNIDALLDAIDPAQHPNIKPHKPNTPGGTGDVEIVQERVGITRREINKLEVDGNVIERAGFSPLQALSSARLIMDKRILHLSDRTYDSTELDSEIADLVQLIERQFFDGGSGGMGGGGDDDPFEDDPFGDEEEPAEWTETERETSTIDVDGVEVTRIDTVTFDVPGGRKVKLVLNHPEE